MRPAARYIAAGVVAAALGAAPQFARAQSTNPSSPSTSGTSTTGTTGSTSTQSASSTTATSSSASATSGVDENAAREHLSQARQALAELTKLPAAAQLQGEQRTAISSLIQAFNGLATATTDWRPKFKAVQKQLDDILGSTASSASTTGTSGASSTATPSSTPSATASNGSASGTSTGAAGGASSGAFDPTILAKLTEVKNHLDAFQEASGDPTPHFDAIDEIVDAALHGSAGASSVGTTGSTGTATDGAGSVSITRAQLEEIKQHVAKLRAATEAAASRKQ